MSSKTVKAPALCECGCGLPAPIAKVTSRARGWVKGEPTRFRRGHGARTPEARARRSRLSRTREHHEHLARARAAQQTPPLAERLAMYTRFDPETGCHVWTAGTSAGYGMVSREGQTTQAHRAAYELRHGRVPDGQLLHHTCRNPLCANPAHLLPVPRQEHPAVHRAEDAIVAAIQAGAHEAERHLYADDDTLTRDELETLSRAQLTEAVAG